MKVNTKKSNSFLLKLSGRENTGRQGVGEVGEGT